MRWLRKCHEALQVWTVRGSNREGAGYDGGILSSAVGGIEVREPVVRSMVAKAEDEPQRREPDPWERGANDN